MRRRSHPIILPLLFFIFLIVAGKAVHIRKIPKDQTIYLAPPESIKLMTFGFDEIVASSLWLRFIQDIEVCGKPTITRAEFEADELKRGATGRSSLMTGSLAEQDVARMTDSLFSFNKDEKVCSRGWAYRVLDAVTELSPRFRPAYSLGATSLSVLANDHLGAKDIFDKGVLIFPQDWVIHYRAAYLYLYEVRDYGIAAHLLNKAAKNGGPPWVGSLASRLLTQIGQFELGYVTLRNYYDSLQDPVRRAEVENRLRRLEQAIRKVKNQQPGSN